MISHMINVLFLINFFDFIPVFIDQKYLSTNKIKTQTI